MSIFKVYGIISNRHGFIFSPSTTPDESTALFSKYFKSVQMNVDTYKIKRMYPGENHNDANKYDDGDNLPPRNFQTADGIIIGVLKFQNERCIRPGEQYVYNPDGTIARDEYGNALTEPTKRETCADIVVDVNGKKGPNQFGKDVFRFSVLSDRYQTPSTGGMGNIEHIIKYNDFDPKIVDYELGGDKL